LSSTSDCGPTCSLVSSFGLLLHSSFPFIPLWLFCYLLDRDAPSSLAFDHLPSDYLNQCNHLFLFFDPFLHEQTKFAGIHHQLSLFRSAMRSKSSARSEQLLITLVANKIDLKSIDPVPVLFILVLYSVCRGSPSSC
jgi:hypothetical protein